MQFYSWSGGRNAALRQYRECVRILDRELGVPPLDETTTLYQAILENHLLAPPALPVKGAQGGAQGGAQVRVEVLAGAQAEQVEEKAAARGRARMGAFPWWAAPGRPVRSGACTAKRLGRASF